MNIQPNSTAYNHRPHVTPLHTNAEPIDLHEALRQDEASRNALAESVNLLRSKGVKGEAMLHELLKVNLKLPRPVSVFELPLIADVPFDEDNPEQYPQMIRRLQEAERQLRNPTPVEEEPRPTRSDVDQAIAARDVKALYANLQALVDIRARSAVEWALKKTEIKEAFGKAINMNDLERAVAAEQRQMEKSQGDDQDIANIARDWAYINRLDFAYDIKCKVWRRWNGTYWEELEPKSNALDNEAIDALHNAGRDVNSLGSIETFLRAACAACARVFPVEQPGKVNFLNGILDTTTMLLTPHCREDYLTSCLPYDYVPGSHKHIDTMLEQIIPDPYARIAFMVHLGLALRGDTRMRSVVILLGTTGSGKTTLLALGNLVCGAQLYEAYNFADHHIFSRELEGKRARYTWGKRKLVGVDEVPSEALRDEELFKQMAAHSGVGMRGMHKDDKEDNRWHPKLLLAANDQPRYRDIVGAVRERCIFIECPNHRAVGTRDLKMIDEAEPELGAFAASCIYLAKLTLERGYYPASSKMKQFLDRIDKEGSYLKSFLAEACVINPDSGDQVTTDDLYEQYISYCENNRVQRQYHLSKAIMSRQIASMRLGVTHTRMLNENNQMVRGLVNIRLRTTSDRWETEDEELRRFQSDAPLIKGRLTVVNGLVTDVTDDDRSPLVSVSELEQPVEPTQHKALTDMTDKIEKISPMVDTLHEEQPNQGVGGSIEEITSSFYPSYPSTASLDQPVEPVQVDDRCTDDLSVDVSEPSVEVSAPRCEVKDCKQVAEPASQEDAERYGHWCSEHADRMEMMALGELLQQPYMRLQYSTCSAVVAGREHWHLFGTYPNAPVQRVLKALNEVLATQSEETA